MAAPISDLIGATMSIGGIVSSEDFSRRLIRVEQGKGRRDRRAMRLQGDADPEVSARRKHNEAGI
jgi:hypothetical protein